MSALGLRTGLGSAWLSRVEQQNSQRRDQRSKQKHGANWIRPNEEYAEPNDRKMP